MQSNDELANHLITKLATGESLRKEIRANILSTSLDAVNQLRRWIIEVITISSAILGTFLALSSQGNNIVSNVIFVKIALYCVILLIGFGLLYIKNALLKDIRNMKKWYEEQDKILSKSIQLMELWLLKRDDNLLIEIDNNSKAFNILRKQDENNNKPDYSFIIISVLFVSFLVLICLSMINFPTPVNPPRESIQTIHKLSK
ncbi:MAG: hypothetical protein WC890_04860 [Candidatus Margulisiibacteriota bacterium]